MVVFAVLLLALLTLLALAIDGGRLYLEQSRLERGVQSGADAGMAWVAEQMVTLAVARQTESAALPPCAPDAGYGTPGASCTATPQPQAIPQWLSDEDRVSLVSAALAATARAVAIDYAGRNGIRSSDPQVVALSVEYPFAYRAEDSILQILVVAQRRTEVLLAGLLGRSFVEVRGEGLSEIPLR